MVLENIYLQMAPNSMGNISMAKEPEWVRSASQMVLNSMENF